MAKYTKSAIIQDFLKNRLKTPNIEVAQDANGYPTFNKFNEPTTLKTDALKCFVHENFSHIQNPHFYVFSDIHAGVPESELERTARNLEMAINDPDAIIILGGDMIDFSIPDSIGDIFGQSESIAISLEKIKNLFNVAYEKGKILENKIAANQGGNHDHTRVEKLVGMSFVDQYVKDPKLFTQGWGVHQFQLKSVINPEKTVNYNVLIQHGEAAKGGPLGTVDAGIKAASQLFSGTVHSVFLGHVHQNAFGTEVLFPRDINNNQIYKNILSVFAIPPAVITQNYSLEKGVKPSNTDNNVIVVEQKPDPNSKNSVYFRSFPYSMDAIYAAQNLIRSNDLESLRQMTEKMNVPQTAYTKEMKSLAQKPWSEENDASIKRAYLKHFIDLTELQTAIEHKQVNFVAPKHKLTTINASERVDTTNRPHKSANTFDSMTSTFPKGLEDIHVYVLGDLYVNSDPKFRVNYKKYVGDIYEIRDDPKAVVIMNGNYYKFDDAVFDFKKGESVAVAYEKFKANQKVTKKYLLNLLKEFESAEMDKERLKYFSGESDSDRLCEYQKEYEKLVENESEISDFDRKSIIAMQKIIYQEYTDLLAKIHEPIKDKIILMNEGSEETKIKNFRDYSPMEQLAEQMGIQSTSSDSRFWLLNAKMNNYLTDGNNATAAILGTYGAKGAYTPTALQNRINSIFKQFPGTDINIVTGYFRNAIFKENAFYLDQNGNLFVKPRVAISLAGYPKVLEPNKVHLNSYDAERDMNRYYIDISIHRDPAYINDNYIDDKGRVIEYDEKFFNSLRPINVPEEKEAYLIKQAKKIPYKVSANLVPFNCKTNLMEDALNNTEESAKIKLKNQIDLVEAFKTDATETYVTAQNAKFPRIHKEKNQLLDIYKAMGE